jgi:hypothetical protein
VSHSLLLGWACTGCYNRLLQLLQEQQHVQCCCSRGRGCVCRLCLDVESCLALALLRATSTLCKRCMQCVRQEIGPLPVCCCQEGCTEGFTVGVTMLLTVRRQQSYCYLFGYGVQEKKIGRVLVRDIVTMCWIAPHK